MESYASGVQFGSWAWITRYVLLRVITYLYPPVIHPYDSPIFKGVSFG